MTIASRFSPDEQAVLHQGDCLDLLRHIPDRSVRLVVTSPPYNLGKAYERRQTIADYLAFQTRVIEESVRTLVDGGSLCWQVGNHVQKSTSSSILPLDILLYPAFANLGLRLRNRVIWHFEHGLHCTNRLSGRYETVLWFTKGEAYYFDVDPIRVPQKYPGKKYFKGPRAGQYSCNPLGKNPGDVWIIPNVKSNHVEKTGHPCQFPVELIERLVLSLTAPGEWVLDPFVGVGTSIVAAVRHQRRGAGAEKDARYAAIARQRIDLALRGELKTRPMQKPVFNPKDAGLNLTTAPWGGSTGTYAEPTVRQLKFFEPKSERTRVK
ncbi:MAG: site-specific DNA-methyltransferase [Opitutus sp.]|nr:site-specific DNA-methyltransferase [Opitutus sp.]